MTIGKIWRIRFAVVAAAISMMACSHGAILTSVAPLADTFVRSGAEKKNFGSEAQIELKMHASGGTSEGYVQFLLPQHAPYTEKARLRFFAQLADPGTLKMLVRSVADTNWSDFSLSWRTRPEHTETIGTVTVVGQSGSWYEVDVTDYVKAEAAAGRQATAFALVPGEESKNKILIQSRESSQKKPELAFTRQPISVRISFLPAKATPPAGHLGDNGEVFGPRTNGFRYGWSADNTEFVRDRSESKYRKDRNPPIKTQDRRYDFTAYMDNEKMKTPLTWEMGLPNGSYKVRIVAGDSFRYDSIYGITAEETTVIDGVPDEGKRWLDATASVPVTDGRLTIGNTASSSNNKLCFIEVSEVESLLTQTR